MMQEFSRPSLNEATKAYKFRNMCKTTDALSFQVTYEEIAEALFISSVLETVDGINTHARQHRIEIFTPNRTTLRMLCTQGIIIRNQKVIFEPLYKQNLVIKIFNIPLEYAGHEIENIITEAGGQILHNKTIFKTHRSHDFETGERHYTIDNTMDTFTSLPSVIKLFGGRMMGVRYFGQHFDSNRDSSRPSDITLNSTWGDRSTAQQRAVAKPADDTADVTVTTQQQPNQQSQPQNQQPMQATNLDQSQHTTAAAEQVQQPDWETVQAAAMQQQEDLAAEEVQLAKDLADDQATLQFRADISTKWDAAADHAGCSDEPSIFGNTSTHQTASFSTTLITPSQDEVTTSPSPLNEIPPDATTTSLPGNLSPAISTVASLVTTLTSTSSDGSSFSFPPEEMLISSARNEDDAFRQAQTLPLAPSTFISDALATTSSSPPTVIITTTPADAADILISMTPVTEVNISPATCVTTTLPITSPIPIISITELPPVSSTLSSYFDPPLAATIPAVSTESTSSSSLSPTPVVPIPTDVPVSPSDSETSVVVSKPAATRKHSSRRLAKAVQVLRSASFTQSAAGLTEEYSRTALQTYRMTTKSQADVLFDDAASSSAADWAGNSLQIPITSETIDRGVNPYIPVTNPNLNLPPLPPEPPAPQHDFLQTPITNFIHPNRYSSLAVDDSSTSPAQGASPVPSEVALVAGESSTVPVEESIVTPSLLPGNEDFHSQPLCTLKRTRVHTKHSDIAPIKVAKAVGKKHINFGTYHNSFKNYQIDTLSYHIARRDVITSEQCFTHFLDRHFLADPRLDEDLSDDARHKLLAYLCYKFAGKLSALSPSDRSNFNK